MLAARARVFGGSLAEHPWGRAALVLGILVIGALDYYASFRRRQTMG